MIRRELWRLLYPFDRPVITVFMKLERPRSHLRAYGSIARPRGVGRLALARRYSASAVDINAAMIEPQRLGFEMRERPCQPTFVHRGRDHFCRLCVEPLVRTAIALQH